MQLLCKKYVLQSVLERAFSVASRGSAIPVLNNVKVDLHEDHLMITGSDSELTMFVRTEQVEVRESGSCLLPPKVLEIVRLCPDEDIVVEVDYNNTAKITCGAVHWEVKLESEEYPQLYAEHSASAFIPKEELQAALNKCRPAIGDTRPIYQIVQIADGKMRACDGVRLHQVDFPYVLDMLLPLRAVQEILRRVRSMGLEQVEVGVQPDSSYYTFKFDDDVLMVSKHNVQFPDVDKFMLEPALANDVDVQIERRPFIEVVRRVAITADEDTNFLTMEFGSDVLNLSTLDKYGNASRESVDTYWPHPNLKIGVNHQYLQAMLAAMASPQFRLLLLSQGGVNASLCFQEEGFVGVLVQLRPDLGDAARGSDRVRPAQSEPVGWGFYGSTVEDAVDESGQARSRRGRRSRNGVVQEPAIVPSSGPDDVDVEDIGTLLEEDD